MSLTYWCKALQTTQFSLHNLKFFSRELWCFKHSTSSMPWKLVKCEWRPRYTKAIIDGAEKVKKCEPDIIKDICHAMLKSMKPIQRKKLFRKWKKFKKTKTVFSNFPISRLPSKLSELSIRGLVIQIHSNNVIVVNSRLEIL